MSTLVRITVAENISSLVDLKPGESEWHETVYCLGEPRLQTPDELEEWAVVCAAIVIGPDRWYDANGESHPMVPYVMPKTYVMAHFSEDL
jgi:hypothetical protein